MDIDDEYRVLIEDMPQHDPDMEVVRWDGDPDPDSGQSPELIIKTEAVSRPNSYPLQDATPCDLNTLAKAKEEATKKAVILSRNELKWKLMQASQIQNKAKLNEIKTELLYHREKLSKTQDLAARLRERYLRVIKSARLSETQLKKAESQFQSQEKFVAEEKMELTKIAYDCLNIGKSLYGDSYKLPANPRTNEHPASLTESSSRTPSSISNGDDPLSSSTNDRRNCESTKNDILERLSPFLRHARTQAKMTDTNNRRTATSKESASSDTTCIQHLPLVMPAKRKASSLKNSSGDDLRKTILRKRRKINNGRLSRIYNTSDSILRSLVTYRLTSKFANTEQLQQGQALTDLTYSHNNSPDEFVCLPDLISQCTDKNCAYKHKSSYMKTDLEKLREILGLKPATTFNFLLSLQMDHKRPLPNIKTSNN